MDAAARSADDARAQSRSLDAARALREVTANGAGDPRVSLAEFQFDDTTHKGSSLTRVDRGALAIVSGQIAKENKDAMKVKTPTSLLAARGTRFVVEVK